MAQKLPTLYIPHGGGPCFFMDWSPMGPADTWHRMARWLGGLMDSVGGKPKALLVVSAHWETDIPTLSSSPRPPLYFDYGGFPEHTYQLEWPAPGHPELARDAARLLSAAGIPSRFDETRGYDHGVFVPLKVALPEADVPVVVLSLRQDLDPGAHLAIGKALAPLREQGVLLVGSGSSYHNLRNFMGGAEGDSRAFHQWLEESLELADPLARAKRLVEWEKAPRARAAHPRAEHLLPLMVAVGAAGDDLGKTVYTDVVMGTTLGAWRFG